MSKETLTDAEKAGLSEEEIAGIEDEESDADALREIAGDSDETFGEHVPDKAKADGDDKGDDAKEKAKDTDGAAADTAAASGAGDASGDGKGDGKDGTGGAATGKDAAAVADEAETTRATNLDREFVPILPVEDVTEATKRLGAIKTEKSGLQNQHKDGDITLEEFLAKRDELDDEFVDLRLKVERATAAMQQNTESAKQRWQFAQESFFEDHQEYDAEKNPVLWGALDGQVKALARDPANAHRSTTWFLKEAHKKVQEALVPANAGGDDKGGEGKPAPAKAATGKDGKPAAKDNGKQPTKADLSKVPTTLAGLPAAAEAETGRGEFDHLDALEGIAYENALARLTADQQTRYLDQ